MSQRFRAVNEIIECPLVLLHRTGKGDGVTPRRSRQSRHSGRQHGYADRQAVCLKIGKKVMDCTEATSASAPSEWTDTGPGHALAQ